MAPIAIADLGRTVRVLGDVLPELQHAPLWESQFHSFSGVIAEEIRALGVTHTALSAATEPNARAGAALVGEAITQLQAVGATAAATPSRGFAPLGAIPFVSRSHDLRGTVPDLEGARQSLLGAQRAISDSPDITLLGTSFSRAGAELITAPAVAAPSNEWVSFNPGRVQRAIRSFIDSPAGGPLRSTVVGAENVPVSGPALLAPTHGAPGDVIFRHLEGHDRTVRSITLDSLRMKWLKHTGSVPLKRGNGQSEEAMAVARGLLADGQVVAMFPEGRIIANDSLSVPRSGIAVLALQTGATVIPTASYGTKQGFTRVGESALSHPRPVVVYGEPISFAGLPATRENVANARERIWAGTEQAYQRAREIYQQAALD